MNITLMLMNGGKVVRAEVNGRLIGKIYMHDDPVSIRSFSVCLTDGEHKPLWLDSQSSLTEAREELERGWKVVERFATIAKGEL